ncbi:MAG: hypothetical protein E7370_00555 [Clostridiales bacterium]|nr:hypothetical protein [Clostridiales bacterium]
MKIFTKILTAVLSITMLFSVAGFSACGNSDLEVKVIDKIYIFYIALTVVIGLIAALFIIGGKQNIKKNQKNILIIILACVISSGVFLGVVWLIMIYFNSLSPTYAEYCDFLYSIEYVNDQGEYVVEEKGTYSFVRLQGLSDAGKGKEIIIVPEYIEGYKVEEIGYSESVVNEGIWESERLKKVYIPFSVSVSRTAFQKCEKLEKVILLAHKADGYDDRNGTNVYCTSYYYEAENVTNKYVSITGSTIYFSNVSYYYNYENAPNDGYYWVDDYDYNSKIEFIPKMPEREGYIFDGWYKEAECINAWNFELDKLPETEYDSEGSSIYQETKLYAKWIG